MSGEIKIELKYCERCGGLWLRRHGDPEVYCATCAPEMRQVALPAKKPSASERWAAVRNLGGVACS